jgi:hypothetical protein
MSRPKCTSEPIVQYKLSDTNIHDFLDRTGDVVWLTKACRCDRYTLRGVPAKRIDVIIDDTKGIPDSHRPGYVWVVDIRKKSGRFDGRERTRITLRLRQSHQVADLPIADLYVEETLTRAIRIYLEIGAQLRWEETHQQLRSDLRDYDPQRIVMWHWNRYYRHLDYTTASQVAELWAAGEFAANKNEWTLAEANRSASRALYRASRDEGWRKLTIRERIALGLSGTGQWHRSDTLASRTGTKTGCGQYTIESASGQCPME